MDMKKPNESRWHGRKHAWRTCALFVILWLIPALICTSAFVTGAMLDVFASESVVSGNNPDERTGNEEDYIEQANLDYVNNAEPLDEGENTASKDIIVDNIADDENGSEEESAVVEDADTEEVLSISDDTIEEENSAEEEKSISIEDAGIEEIAGIAEDISIAEDAVTEEEAGAAEALQKTDGKVGLVACYPVWGANGPSIDRNATYYGEIGSRASYEDCVVIGWAKANGEVKPISLNNLNKFTFTTTDGKNTEYRFSKAGNWGDTFVPYGDGFFALGFLKPGDYIMTYSGSEASGASKDARSVIIHAYLPDVGVYKANKASAGNLRWLNNNEYKNGDAFYILPYSNIYDDGWKTEVSVTKCSLRYSQGSKLTKTSTGYKLDTAGEIAEGFEVRIEYHVREFQYNSKTRKWAEEDSYDNDVNANFLLMEKYGLVTNHAQWKPVSGTNDQKPVYSTVDMRSFVRVSADDHPAICLAWKDAKGVMKAVPSNELDKLKVYDSAGKEVKNGIRQGIYWDSSKEKFVSAGNGLFQLSINKLGDYRIEYSGGTITETSGNMTKDIIVKVIMPMAGLYKSDQPSFENLLVPDIETGEVYYTDTSRTFYVNAVEEFGGDSFKRTISSFQTDQIEVHGSFEEKGVSWKKRITFKKIKNGVIQVNVLSGFEDLIEFYIPYTVKDYSWNYDEGKWHQTGEFQDRCYFRLGYKKYIDISHASVSGISLSYGYSGQARTPAFTVSVDGKELKSGKDYTYSFKNNTNPGTATLTITGKGDYSGKRVKTFEIVDCVQNLENGKTYQIIPKNNSKTAVCSYSGKMVNNTKVYITDRSSSEAMRFKALKQSDGSWKFINAKCELALAVQQNSSELGKGLVLYTKTSKPAQAWTLSRKSDNSFAIMNAVTGYSIAMSDASAVKGTILSMAKTASSGLQRFYFAETEAVSSPYSGTHPVRAAKNKAFALNIASSSKADGANVNLYTYSNTNAKKFRFLYSGGGYYRVENVNSGLVLTVKGNTKTDGANVIQSAWKAQSGQRWKVTKNADGTLTLTNALGTVLHLNGNNTADGTNVLAKIASSTSAQRWRLG